MSKSKTATRATTKAKGATKRKVKATSKATSKGSAKRGNSTASKISFKSAATVRKRSKFIESLSPTKREIANAFFDNTLEQVYRKFQSKKSLVTTVVRELSENGIYFKNLKSQKSKSLQTSK